MRSVELFAGGGGLLLGGALAGFKHDTAVEWDRWSCDTLRENRDASHPLIRGLNIIHGDVRKTEWNQLKSEPDLVSGGPPCQPFSMGGLARSADDPRDMFPAMTEAIAQLRPRAFVVENVRGLTRSSFSEYFNFILLRLQHPEIRAKEGERWIEHYSRLNHEHGRVESDLKYSASATLVNAADYGIPQHRHRVFIVGFREDLETKWEFPQPTHSGKALRNSQESGEYWDKWSVADKDRLQVRAAGGDESLKPWKTVREALDDLPEPAHGGSGKWMDHRYQPGAKIYPGHTGSPLDQPSKALKAGGHGVPGGENMIRYPDGSVRYYSLREAARIQTFPDDYSLHGAWSEAMRQLGNAVPVELGRVVLEAVGSRLQSVSLSV